MQPRQNTEHDRETGIPSVVSGSRDISRSCIVLTSLLTIPLKPPLRDRRIEAATMAPLLRMKKNNEHKRRREGKTIGEVNEDERVQQLFRDIDAHMALDRILEARKVVDKLPATAVLSRERQTQVQHIRDESTQIQEMLHDLKSDEGWTFANKRKGVTVHYRHEEGSSIHTIKTHTILENYTPTDFLYLLSLFLEADLMGKWFPKGVRTTKY